MKHHSGELLSLVMGDLLAGRMRRRHTEFPFDCVVPVPMHWLRRLFRPVHVPSLLAERVSAGLSVGTRRALRFRRNVRRQSTLSPAMRRQNVRGALAVKPGYHLADAHVLLIDDILTTGATANEATRCLRRAGAKSVHVAVVARGGGFDEPNPSAPIGTGSAETAQISRG
jgi:predicted amidophosphoribosyltransferase